MASNGDDQGNKRAKFDSFDGGNRSNKVFNNSDNYNDEPRRKNKENYLDVVKANNILLFTVINPNYPITTDVLHTICSPSGTVARIVVFKKNGVQAMVEFDTLESAVRAKDTLNGADIYSGCCTLKIEYAKPTKLNVHKNDYETWDYTLDNIREETPSRPPRPSLLPEPNLLPPPNYNQGPPAGPSFRGGGGGGYPNDDYYGAPPYNNNYNDRNYGNPVLDKFIGKPRGPHPGMGGGPNGFNRPPLVRNPPMTQVQQPAPVGAQGGGSCVLMVYELEAERSNPDKVFNLFCLYGNVSKVKFLKTKEGCCMIQMGDLLSSQNAHTNLARAPLINGKKLAVAFSKQVFLSDVAVPFELPDKTPSFKDFTGSRNNRFMNPRMAQKNRIQPPSQIIHFFNSPPDISEESLIKIFTDAGVKRPKAVTLFPTKSSDDKPASSSSGLIEFDDVKHAVDGIMQCNHHPIQSEGGKYPFLLKLCFSSSKTLNAPRKFNNNSYEEDYCE